jgi:membrane-associated phospholipid phosphatase
MRCLYLLVFALFLISPLAVSAQQEDRLDIPRSSDPGKQPWVRQFVADEVTIWTSPFRKSSYSGRAFKKYVIPFTLITGALLATDHRTAEWLPNTEDQSRWSLRVSQVGAPYTLAGMAAGMYLISRMNGDRKARETGFLGAIAIAHTQLVTLGLKTISQRERPADFRANNSGGMAFFKGGDSFPSGHASSSFGLATIFAYEYGREHRWVPYTAYGIASVVAASRLSAQKHWISDIFVGASMGFMIGRFVYKTHHNPSVDGLPPSRSERLIPQFGLTGRGLTLTWSL